MNHEFRVTVVSSTKSGLEAAAIARADKFFGPGNWRELDAAFVTETFAGNYEGEYYFTDVPEIGERTWAVELTRRYIENARINIEDKN